MPQPWAKYAHSSEPILDADMHTLVLGVGWTGGGGFNLVTGRDRRRVEEDYLNIRYANEILFKAAPLALCFNLAPSGDSTTRTGE